MIQPTTAFSTKPSIFFIPDFKSFNTMKTAAMTPTATSMLVHSKPYNIEKKLSKSIKISRVSRISLSIRHSVVFVKSPHNKNCKTTKFAQIQKARSFRIRAFCASLRSSGSILAAYRRNRSYSVKLTKRNEHGNERYRKRKHRHSHIHESSYGE